MPRITGHGTHSAGTRTSDRRWVNAAPDTPLAIRYAQSIRRKMLARLAQRKTKP
jgi:hypothetical protein